MAKSALRHLLTVPLVLLALTLTLAACAPSAGVPRPAGTTAAGEPSELRRTALVAFHRMEIAFLQTGSYTTNALIDLDLPRGVRWTLEEFSETGYRLRFTDDDRPDVAWLVSPEGVRSARPGNA
ncbi:MAG: hypothetical protein WD314_07190 [Trueperaceae bacterium]